LGNAKEFESPALILISSAWFSITTQQLRIWLNHSVFIDECGVVFHKVEMIMHVCGSIRLLTFLAMDCVTLLLVLTSQRTLLHKCIIRLAFTKRVRSRQYHKGCTPRTLSLSLSLSLLYSDIQLSLTLYLNIILCYVISNFISNNLSNYHRIFLLYFNNSFHKFFVF